MTTISLEIEAKNVTGLFGSSIGAYGYLPDNPLIAEIPVMEIRRNGRAENLSRSDGRVT